MAKQSSGTTPLGWLIVGLTLMFVWLRLTGQIDWEWYWVASPFLIPIGLCVAAFAVYLVAAFIVAVGTAMFGGTISVK
jgi:hypothetical protein